MYLSEKIAYHTALVTRTATLSVKSTRLQVAAVCEILIKKNISNQDTVMVILSDEMQLLPLVWALVRLGITCLFYDPSVKEADVNNIVHKVNPQYIITDQHYRTGLIDHEVILIADALLSEALWNEHTETVERAFSFAFYDHHRQEFYTSNKRELHQFYNKLDREINAQTGDHILLTKCLPFHRRILELIWASSRGITVIVDQLDNNLPFNRYVQAKDVFNMNFGLFYFGSYVEEAESERYKLLFDTAKYADEHGFTSVWTPERHFNEFGGLYPNPSVISAALAVSTAHVQIRSGSLVAPLHHAARIAEDWSVVDNLSGGRAAISFASGWQCDDFVFFPDNYALRHEHMMQQVNEVKRLWKGEKVSFKNGLGNYIEVAIYPKPVQKKLPVWITVAGKIETFIDAGKIGANILTHLLWQNTDELIDKIAAYRKSLKDHGFDPKSGIVSVMAHTYLGTHNEAVKDKVREPLKNYIRSSTQLIQAMVKSNDQAMGKQDKGRYGTVNGEIPEHLLDELAEIAFDRFFDQAGLLGTVEKVKKMIHKLKSYDVDEVACLTDFGLGRNDILKGLTYLNELREFYDNNHHNLYPVSIVHCNKCSLSAAISSPPIADFLGAQKQVIVEAEDFDDLPKSLLSKTVIMHELNPNNLSDPVIRAYSFSEEELKSSFNTFIDEDF